MCEHGQSFTSCKPFVEVCRVDHCDERVLQNMQNNHDEMIPVKAWGRYTKK